LRGEETKVFEDLDRMHKHDIGNNESHEIQDEVLLRGVIQLRAQMLQQFESSGVELFLDDIEDAKHSLNVSLLGNSATLSERISYSWSPMSNLSQNLLHDPVSWQETEYNRFKLVKPDPKNKTRLEWIQMLLNRL
jgi:hypothetical protein